MDIGGKKQCINEPGGEKLCNITDYITTIYKRHAISWSSYEVAENLPIVSGRKSAIDLLKHKCVKEEI